jgi:outer membrane protein assembly factor BamB
MLGDRVFGASANTTAVTSWAFSLKPGQEGTLIFSNTWAAPADWAAGNVTLRLEPETLDSMQYGVFVVTVHETRTHYGFSTTTGQFLWGPTPPQYYLDMYQDANGVIVDGYFISGTMSGIISCYNVTTGELLWKHGSTDYYSEARYSSNYPRRNPASFVSNGKIYTGSYEHSPNQPLPRGTPFECINEKTGELIWTIPFYAGSYYQTSLMGDSIIAAFNSYDNRIYAMGKGPSSTTVQAPLTSVNVGGSLVIQGTVMDVSPGTKSTDLTLTFPNGVPAVSDASQTQWMQHVYYQFPETTNATGVPVSIDAVDPNGNFVHLGNTTSDSSGLYSIAWTPPNVPGKYIIIASFAGSEAYYPSSAETAAVVTEAPQPTATSTPLPLSISDMYFIPAIAGLFVLIIAVAVVLALLMLRKRP